MYFSNSSHGVAFEIKNCEGCARHNPDDPERDCPLKLATFIHNDASGLAADVLNLLQRRVGDHDQIGTCLMRVELPPSSPLDLEIPGHKLPGLPAERSRWTAKDQARVFLHAARRDFERRNYDAARRAAAPELVAGEPIRLLRDKGPIGEVVAVSTHKDAAELVDVIALFPVEELWAWLFHYNAGEIFHQ